MSKSVKIAIVGGGLSGSLVAIYLLKYIKYSLEILLFEKSTEQLYRGAAYSSKLPYQLLNVPVNGMSLFQEDNLHFFNWLNDKNIKAAVDDFVSRKLFGDYVEETMQKYITENNVHHFQIIQDEVIDVTTNDSKTIVYSKKHLPVEVNKVYLCTGNFLPESLKNSSLENLVNNYIQNPWDGKFFSKIKPNDTVFILGTGLSMVDWVMSLCKNENFKGKIIALSRRGFLPLSHGLNPAYQLQKIPDFNTSSILDIYYWIKSEVKYAESQHKNYRSVIDAVRPFLNEIWGTLSKEDKQQFCRHIKPFWDIHRHRIPVHSFDFLNQLINEQILEIISGRLIGVDDKENEFSITFQPKRITNFKTIKSNWIINCTGPQTNYTKIDDLLFQNMLISETFDTGDINLGLVTQDMGFIVAKNGKINENIIMIGPAAKGNLWEIIALNEIKQQIGYFVKLISSKTL